MPWPEIIRVLVVAIVVAAVGAAAFFIATYVLVRTNVFGGIAQRQKHD